MSTWKTQIIVLSSNKISAGDLADILDAVKVKARVEALFAASKV